MTGNGTSNPGFIGVVYGVRLETSPEYRYVGLTTASVRRRTQQHFKNAESGIKNPFYDWLRKAPEPLVYVAVLQVVTTDLQDLGQAEIDWIARLRESGDRLLNLSEGGLGPTGVTWAAEQRDAARIRATGRPGLSRPGPENPFFGRNHSEEQKASWRESRRGSNTGAENANFGKFGAEHPSFGHVMSAESRARLSVQKSGALNPNFGKTPSAEVRAKLSAATKGIPQPKSARSAHTRHHTNKDVIKPDCKYCVEDAAQHLNASPTEMNTND